MVDVVGAQDGPGKLLQQVIFFVAAFGRRQYADPVRTVAGFDPVELFRNQVKGIVPGGGPEPALTSNQGVGQPFGAVDEFMGVPAFDAEVVPGYGMIAARA